MNIEDKISYEKKISELSDREQKLRDLYLSKLAKGEYLGPQVGYASIDKPWLGNYSEEAILFENEKTYTYDNMRKNNLNHQDRLALKYFGKQLTYRELFEKIDTVTKSFLAYGIKKGDIITLALPNIPENLYSFYALNRIGAIVNFIDLRLKGDKLVDAINCTDSKFILATDLFLDNLNEIVDQTNLEKVVVCSPFDSIPVVGSAIKLTKPKPIMLDDRYIKWKNFEKIGKNLDIEPEYTPTYDDVVCILHTSGTTGKPKGVMLTNRNFIEMVSQVRYSGLKQEAGGVFLNQVPPFLAYNILSATNNPLTMGLTIDMLPDYVPEKFADNILKHKPQHVIAGPADYNNMLENPKIAKSDLSFLVTAISGSDKNDEIKKEQMDDLLHSCGCTEHILEGYGMTEVGAAAVLNLPDKTVPGSVGVPLRNVNLCIYDNDKEQELGYGQVGEICLSGPTTMVGYYKNEEETKNIMRIHKDGTCWIHTGDLGYVDKDGVLFIKGRMKRIIVNHEGFKISPLDLEKVITSTGLVKSCCVTGVKDREMGRGFLPVANIVLADNEMSVSDIIEAIQARCKSELGERYQPADYIVQEELPLTDVGKVDYRKLTELNEIYYDEHGQKFVLRKKIN